MRNIKGEWIMKKLASVALAVVSAATLAGLTASAAVQPSVRELRDLGDAILGKSAVAEKHDINGDGNVDVYDLVTMRKEFGHTGVFTSEEFRADDENVRYIGRGFSDDDGVYWLVQSGASAEFTITGRAASIDLRGDYYVVSNKENCPRYAIFVDGELFCDEQLSSKRTSVELFSGEESRTVTVKIMHLSEANQGAVGIDKITVDSDVPVPVAPTIGKKMRIEFIGDSITCAYGVEGKDQYEGFKVSTENFMKSYAYLTAEKLGAECSAVSYSGYGIVSGYSSSGNKQGEKIVPDNYENVGFGSYKKPWDFESNKNDVVVINLGTNDDTYVSKDFDSRSPEYTKGYAEFLEKVHRFNPDAYIICTLGTMGCTELYPCIEQAVELFRAEIGWEKIMCYQSQTQSQDDGYGSDWHPSAKTHQNSAYVLADKICQALGIESDQYGIDAAAQAKFSYVKSDDANMSAYFSDWDRSYHITTVTGGSNAKSIQAKVSDIELRKGGKYRLEFKLETDKEHDIPLRVSGAASGTLFHDDSITGTGSKSGYEAVFTASESGQAEIVFDIGGADALRCSIYDLRLVRIG